MKSTFSFLIMILLAGLPVYPMGGQPPGLEILVVPSEPNMVRVGLDLVEREDLLLLSYAPASDPADPFLHVWDGSAWLRVPSARYFKGTFLKVNPAKVIVVGGDRPVTRSLIEGAVPWSPEVLNIAPQSVTDLINSVGKLFQFSRSDWKWFAAEYDLLLEDLTRSRDQTSWYDSHTPADIPPAESPFKRRSPARSPAGTAPQDPVSLPPVGDEGAEELDVVPLETEPIPLDEPEEAFSMDVDEP